MDVHLIGRHLIDMHLMGRHLMGMHLIGKHLMGMQLIYESSLRAGHGWRESLYRHQRCIKLLIVGDRVVKSCRKDCPTASVLLEAKAAALHPKRYQSSLSKLSKKGRVEAGKRSAGNRIG
jgi:hypothetical protein